MFRLYGCVPLWFFAGCTPPTPTVVAESDADTDTDTDTDADAEVDGARVFTTSGRFDGDFGGIVGAIDVCAAAAEAGGLEGKYLPWLSTSAVDAVDLVQGDGPWYLVGTETVAFSNRGALRGTPRVPIDRDEYGELIPSRSGFGGVWTTTVTGGTLNGGNPPCDDWTDRTYFAGAGLGSAHDEDRWTLGDIAECYELHHLYCFGD